jgi:hypothetical protein
MNQQEVSFRSDEQAQSQDRERLQEDLRDAWLTICGQLPLEMKPNLVSAVRLIEWHLGV